MLALLVVGVETALVAPRGVLLNLTSELTSVNLTRRRSPVKFNKDKFPC